MENKGLKHTLHTIIFEAETKAGKVFDVALLIAILLSVLVIMLDTVPSINSTYGKYLTILEWIFTAFFSIEYIIRITITKKPLKYALSFMGIVDLISCLLYTSDAADDMKFVHLGGRCIITQTQPHSDQDT